MCKILAEEFRKRKERSDRYYSTNPEYIVVRKFSKIKL